MKGEARGSGPYEVGDKGGTRRLPAPDDLRCEAGELTPSGPPAGLRIAWSCGRAPGSRRPPRPLSRSGIVTLRRPITGAADRPLRRGEVRWLYAGRDGGRRDADEVLERRTCVRRLCMRRIARARRRLQAGGDADFPVSTESAPGERSGERALRR